MVMNYPRTDVRMPPAAPWSPALSLLVVRWGGEETEFNVEQWGSASASTSSAYVSAFLDKTVYPTLGPDYEVISVFVTSGLDMARLGPATVCAMMRGRHRAGCYFLWPVMHQDGEVGARRAPLAGTRAQCAPLPGEIGARVRHAGSIRLL